MESSGCQQIQKVISNDRSSQNPIFSNSKSCAQEPWGQACQADWEEAKATLDQRYEQMLLRFQQIMKKQMHVYFQKVAPPANAVTLGAMYQPQAVVSHLVQMYKRTYSDVQQQTQMLAEQFLQALPQAYQSTEAKGVVEDLGNLQDLEQRLQNHTEQVKSYLSGAAESQASGEFDPSFDQHMGFGDSDDEPELRFEDQIQNLESKLQDVFKDMHLLTEAYVFMSEKYEDSLATIKNKVSEGLRLRASQGADLQASNARLNQTREEMALMQSSGQKVSLFMSVSMLFIMFFIAMVSGAGPLGWDDSYY
jgi:hypothetical protein